MKRLVGKQKNEVFIWKLIFDVSCVIKRDSCRIFALHLKENSSELFSKVGEAVRSLKNCFLFATDFNQDEFINEMFDAVGKEHLALYVRDRDIDSGLVNKVDYFWNAFVRHDKINALGIA